MRNTIRTLTALKHAVPALDDKTPVDWVTVTGSTSVLAYSRKAGDSEVLVVLNMSTSAVNATLTDLTAGDWSLWLNSETIAEGTSRQQILSALQTVSLEAKGYHVYVRGIYSEEQPSGTAVAAPVANHRTDHRVFSLSGLPVQPVRAGIYICDGKKIIVK